MGVPKQVVLALLIELSLIFMTTVFLIQPKRFFRFQAKQALSVVSWAGMVLLCLTFCWSVIFGCVLALNQLILRI